MVLKPECESRINKNQPSHGHSLLYNLTKLEWICLVEKRKFPKIETHPRMCESPPWGAPADWCHRGRICLCFTLRHFKTEIQGELNDLCRLHTNLYRSACEKDEAFNPASTISNKSQKRKTSSKVKENMTPIRLSVKLCTQNKKCSILVTLELEN